jgi:hypothetical protein
MALMDVDFVGWLSISKDWWGGWKEAKQHYSVNNQESKISLLSSSSVVNGEPPAPALAHLRIQSRFIRRTLAEQLD